MVRVECGPAFPEVIVGREHKRLLVVTANSDSIEIYPSVFSWCQLGL